MKRSTFTFALVLSTLCFALLGNGCSENSSVLGPEQIAASDIPEGDGQMAYRNPAAPTLLQADWSRGRVTLDWECDCDAVLFFRVYRKIDGGAATMVRATSHRTATDDLRYMDYQKVVYWVTGVNAYGNESAASRKIGANKNSQGLPNVENPTADGQI
jgi:hypothetical protein